MSFLERAHGLAHGLTSTASSGNDTEADVDPPVGRPPTSHFDGPSARVSSPSSKIPCHRVNRCSPRSRDQRTDLPGRPHPAPRHRRHRMAASPSRAASAPDIANLDSAAPKASASASTETVNPFYRAPCLPPAGHGTRGAQGNRSSNPPTDRKINRSPASTGYSASRRHTSRDGNPPGTG